MDELSHRWLSSLDPGNETPRAQSDGPPAPRSSGKHFRAGPRFYMVRLGIVFAILAILLMLWAYLYTHTLVVPNDPARWKTMVFPILCLSQMGHAIAVRSERHLALEMSQFTNPYVLFAVISTTLLQLILIYIPFLRSFLGTYAFSVTALSVCIGFSMLLFVWVELEKLWLRNRL